MLAPGSAAGDTQQAGQPPHNFRRTRALALPSPPPQANADVFTFQAPWSEFNTPFSWSFEQLVVLHYNWPFAAPVSANASEGVEGFAKAVRPLITRDNLAGGVSERGARAGLCAADKAAAGPGALHAPDDAGAACWPPPGAADQHSSRISRLPPASCRPLLAAGARARHARVCAKGPAGAEERPVV